MKNWRLDTVECKACLDFVKNYCKGNIAKKLASLEASQV